MVEEATDAGASVVQLREKDLPTRLWVEEAQKVREVTHRRGIPLIINDRIDIALAVDADGVHLGQEDMPLALARKIAPSPYNWLFGLHGRRSPGSRKRRGRLFRSGDGFPHFY